MNDILVLNELPKLPPITEAERAALDARFPSRKQGRKLVVLSIALGDYGENVFPFKVGDVFPSVTEAARRIGHRTPVPLHTALRFANGAPAKLRGVTFQYLDVYQKGK